MRSAILQFAGFLFLLFIWSVGILQAQEQAGSMEGVIKNVTGETLPGVHVSVPDLQIGTTTNSEGSFNLRSVPAGEHIVRISMVGFQTHTETIIIEPGQTVRLEVELTSITLQAGELVVTASRRSQLIGRVSVSMNTVSPEEIRSRNITSLDQALDYVPGVQVLGNSVNIRGSSGYAYGVGSRVLLLVDGVPLMGPDQGSMDFDGLPLMQTRQIEVLKSPGSALYGGGALGGVINLITRDFPDEPETTVRFFSGLYEPVRFEEWQQNWDGASGYRPATGVLFGRSEQVGRRFGYWLSGKLEDDMGYLQNNRTRGLELYSKLGWNFTDEIDLSLYTSIRRNRNQQFLYWNGLRDPLRPGEIQLPDDTARGANEGLSDRVTILPVFTHRINPNIQYSIKGRLFGAAFRPVDSEGNVRPSDRHNVGVRYGGEGQVDIRANDNLMLIGGISFDENYIRSDVYVGDDSLMVRNQPEGALFFQAEYTWNDRLITTAGFRYDAYQVHTLDTATQFSPKFSASYVLTDDLTARASVGKGFRVPSVAERFFDNQDYFPVRANLALRPETSTGYEAGITWQRLPSAMFHLKMEITGFWNEYQRLVEPTFQAGVGAFQFVNLTEARIRGTEASVSLTSTDQNHHFTTSYTLLDPKDLEEDRALVYRSRHLLQASARSKLTTWLETGADFRYASAPEQVDTDFSIFVSDAGAFPDVYVTDFRLRFLGGQWIDGLDLSATFLVRNLFDYYYVERPAIFAPPRSYQVVVEFRF
jgi:outer membrane receptor for ferrienterochelin and colicins